MLAKPIGRSCFRDHVFVATLYALTNLSPPPMPSVHPPMTYRTDWPAALGTVALTASTRSTSGARDIQVSGAGALAAATGADSAGRVG